MELWINVAPSHEIVYLSRIKLSEIYQYSYHEVCQENVEAFVLI